MNRIRCSRSWLIAVIALSFPSIAPANAPSITAADALEEALALEREGVLAIAAERFQEAHALSPSAETLAGLARCFHQLRELELARIYYLQYLEKNAGDHTARTRLADVQLELGDFRGAFHSYRTMLPELHERARAGMAAVLGRKARQLLKDGKPEAAERLFARASRLEPADPRWRPPYGGDDESPTSR